jgi:HEPN domain-containing protein
LSIEKLAKAVWVKEHKDDFPPKIHNLINLFARTSLNLSDEQHQLLNQLNFFQIEGRYPDYNSKANKVASRKHTKELIRRANRFQKWVLKQMQ